MARLKRGRVGAYVTTSYFSESVQREVIEDAYPILLINGLRLAAVVLQLVNDEGYASLDNLLRTVDSEYDAQVLQRRPEELLLE